ncbi:DinB family protein [Dinghuibacter silviterrae]|uniref:DinB family protein n=1 Tax=Dinghuibacter silviterrae TaxID=1539049 RepID=A0A4R8DI53_9BACT|nr:DinB family protein [Dinghuibacter silviterrae]TDW97227.1 DinB family protein [Dinghuibacter silviterrae]
MARPENVLLPYKNYVDLVDENDIFLALEHNLAEIKELLGAIHSSKLGYAYAPGKWTVAQLLQHVIDAERIFDYRALRIARGDKTPLPNWEEDDYARMAPADHRTLADLSEEILSVRKASTLLLYSFTDDCWERTGTTSGKQVDVLTIAFLIVGHMRHHIKILRERYEIQP